MLRLGRNKAEACLVWGCWSTGLPTDCIGYSPLLLLYDETFMDQHTQTPASHCCSERPSHICTARSWHQAPSLGHSGCLVTNTFWHRFWPVPTSSVPGIAWALFRDEHLLPRGNPVEVILSRNEGGKKSV